MIAIMTSLLRVLNKCFEYRILASRSHQHVFVWNIDFHWHFNNEPFQCILFAAKFFLYPLSSRNFFLKRINKIKKSTWLTFCVL